MKLATFAYVPPLLFRGAQAFWDNLQKFPACYDLVLFSDPQSHWPTRKLICSVEAREAGSLKQAKFESGKPNRFGIPNVLFFTALRMAKAQGYSHIIFLESDCRVGCAAWDERIFNEYFNLPGPTIAAGTLVAQNPCNFSGAAARRWAELVCQVINQHGRPLATYGWQGGADRHAVNLFPNGALAVYDVAWMGQLFDLEQTTRSARHETAFDMALGLHVWQRFEEQCFDVLGYLGCVYSGYADVLNNEEQRLALLRAGSVVAIHQVKSEASV